MHTGRADLHIHSLYSYDSTNSVEVVLDQARAAKLDVIAISDHNTMEGVAKAQALAPDYGIEVIPACEISTRQGHLLAFFLDRPIPRGLPLAETLALIGAAGGLAVAPHPMAAYTHSLGATDIEAALAQPDLAKVLVGIEVINRGLPERISNRRSRELCERLGLAATGSSDAHVSWMIGSAVTRFPGRTAADLKRALLEVSTWAEADSPERLAQKMGSSLYHFLLRQMGWALWAPAGGGNYQLKRLAELLN